MREIKYLIIILLFFGACKQEETSHEILQKTIDAINTIETLYYKQDMIRSNPRKKNDTLTVYREMYFKRLVQDSIVGVKGHWYFYKQGDKNKTNFEDIYDGNRLLRLNKKDSTVVIFDLIKYPEYRKKHFWGHNTPYAMQFELKQILDNSNYYNIERLRDTIYNDKECYQILIRLEDMMSSLPGFRMKLQENDGSISSTLFFIDKITNYPIRMKSEMYNEANPEERFFIDQTYNDLKFNLIIEEDIQFDTSINDLQGYKIIEKKP